MTLFCHFHFSPTADLDASAMAAAIVVILDQRDDPQDKAMNRGR